MDRFEAQAKEANMIGDLSGPYAFLMAHRGFILHNITKDIYNVNIKNESLLEYLKNLLNKGYEISKNKDLNVKIKYSEMLFIWSEVLEEAYLEIENTVEDSNEREKLLAILLGEYDITYFTKLLILIYTGEFNKFIERIKKYDKEKYFEKIVDVSIKEYNEILSKDNIKISDRISQLRIIFYIIKEIFKHYETIN